MTQVPIAYIDVSFLAHATEDENKVVEAAKNLLPPAHLEDVNFNRRALRGHHRNPIIHFEARIKEKEVIKAIMERLASSLADLDKERLLKTIGLHVERGNMYLRFDKQAAYRKEFRLGVADSIRFRLRFRKNRLTDIVNICREIGMLP